VQDKERRNVELKRIITHNLSDGVRTIMDSTKLLIRSGKEFFLHMQPNFIAHPKLMWHLMMIMALLVLVIGLL
jgi:hypothetical protein